MSRKFPHRIKCVVVKVGSSVIASYKLKPHRARLQSLVDQISILQSQGVQVILVSSGAIVLGRGEISQNFKPSDLASLQACAAIGQNVLMRTYGDLFKKYDLSVAQLLLTWEDFDNRARFNNARNTLKAILGYGAVPIINENDTISTDEIKFGDNDKLSALVASLIGADLLVILSDVEGLYNMKSERKEVIREIKDITDDIRSIATDTSKRQVSKGGMIAKLDAIKIATHANIPCVIASGETDAVLLRILNGEQLGTFFYEKEDKLLARRHWISFLAKPKGQIIVDDGAKAALLTAGKSLLLPGLVSWEGTFKTGDVVIVQDRHHQEIARGISNYSVQDLYRIQDKKNKTEVIHRDDLVLCQT